MSGLPKGRTVRQLTFSITTTEPAGASVLICAAMLTEEWNERKVAEANVGSENKDLPRNSDRVGMLMRLGRLGEQEKGSRLYIQVESNAF